MHAVVVSVTVNDPGPAEELLRSQVVPRVSSAPGFVAAYWTRSTSADDNRGLSMLVFDSEDAARAAAGQIQSPSPDAVTVDDVEVREVIADA